MMIINSLNVKPFSLRKVLNIIIIFFILSVIYSFQVSLSSSVSVFILSVDGQPKTNVIIQTAVLPVKNQFLLCIIRSK